MRESYTSKKSSENKSAKRVRITMAVLYFIEVILTTFPFMQGDAGDGTLGQLTAFEIAVRPGGYADTDAVKQALLFGVFILFPIIAFFFCILDRKSNLKNFISAACCVICVVLIVFVIGPQYIALGSVLAIILYIVILFLTAQGFQASIIRDEKP